jgi:hypothetical protein
MSGELHEFDRREIFLQIVRMQDEGISLVDSRSCIAAQFDIDVDGICEIEAEGIAKMWPPL